MSEWKEYKLGKLVDVLSSKRIFYKDYVSSGIPFYRSKEIIEKSENKTIDKPLFISEEKFQTIKEKYGIPTNGDILISSVGMRSGIPYLVYDDGDFYFKDGNLIWLRNFKNDLDSLFLCYWLKSDLGQFSLENIMIGSAQPALTIAGLRNLELQLPKIQEQKIIAEILSSIDGKIELLNRQNKTLEQMAETLFRQWFVEEAKEDWDYIELGGFIKCYNGVSYKSSELNPSDIAMVTLKSFARDGSFRLDGFKEFTGNFKAVHIVKQGDLVVAHTDITQDAALVGNPVLVIGIEEYKTLIISMDLVKVEPKFKWMSKEFLYFLMKSRIFKQHCLGYANGSTVLHLSKDAIPTFEFFLPPKDKIEEFSKHASWLLNKKNLNISQIRSLEKLRDTLLPKLMSGEVILNMKNKDYEN